MRVKKETVLLLTVLAISLVMRILPVASDLPYCSSLDERSYIETALRFGTGTLTLPSFFHGGLYQLILFLEYAAYFVLGRALGAFSSSTDFFLAYIKDPSLFFLLARVTVALCGAGVVWLSYAIASTTYQRRVGLLAAVFTAFSLLTFQMSFLALADMPAVFLLLLAIYLAVLSVQQPGERRLYCAAAALVGLATAAKYHAAFGIIPLAVAAFIKNWSRQDRIGRIVQLGVLGFVFVAAGFCIGLPQFVVDPSRFYEDVFHGIGSQYAGYNPDRDAWRFLFAHHLRNGLGIPLEVASLLGLAFALYKRSKWDFMLLSFPASFYLLFMHSVGFAYHLLPAVPFMLILAARFLDAIVEKGLRGESLGASVLLASVVVAPSLLDSLRLVQVMRSPSTKTAAKTWIEAHIPDGSTLMAEGYMFTDPIFGPPLVESRSSLDRDRAFVKEKKGAGRIPELRLSHYEWLYGGARAFDILKLRFLDSEAVATSRSPFLIMTTEGDRPVGKELERMFLPRDFGEKRAAVRENIRRSYAVVATFAPAVEFTNLFPHLMDEDYRLIRDWPLFSSSRSRGPTITVWERRAR